MPRTFTVYILASLSRRLYVGVTADLLRRIHEHRMATLPSFTARYRINRLVHFEQTTNARAAIQRETEIKQWSRKKKIQLIESTNAGWLDIARYWFPSDCHFERGEKSASCVRLLAKQIPHYVRNDSQSSACVLNLPPLA